MKTGSPTSSAGTKRRFSLPKWARHEMAALENEMAHLQADGRLLLRRRDDLAKSLMGALMANQSLFGAKFNEVHVLRNATKPVVTLYQIVNDRIEPIVAVRPGDSLVVARKTES